MIIYLVVNSEAVLTKTAVNGHDNGIFENSIYGYEKPTGQVTTDVSFFSFLLLTTHYQNSLGLLLYTLFYPVLCFTSLYSLICILCVNNPICKSCEPTVELRCAMHWLVLSIFHFFSLLLALQSVDLLIN